MSCGVSGVRVCRTLRFSFVTVVVISGPSRPKKVNGRQVKADMLSAVVTQVL